ncbi:class I SAM-dependent methyltransferase [Pseudodesulfovibrio cashew]|nr:class I SAM-dependent methyltransferase [Pseudodesulfovibrio cashew]
MSEQKFMIRFCKAGIISITACYQKTMALLCGKHPNLYPWHFQWTAIRDLNRDLADVLPTLEGRVLDAGCGLQPYRFLLPSVTDYVGMDVVPGPFVDYLVKTGERFPFLDESLDAVLCTQVLEHVEDEVFFLDEIARVLKPGGRLVISIPFIYQVHGAPHDYRRLSEFGLRRLLPGYTVERVNHQGGIGTSLATLSLGWLHTQLDATTPTSLVKMLITPLLLPLQAVVNLLGVLLDCCDSTRAFYGNLLAVAVKNSDGSK